MTVHHLSRREARQLAVRAQLLDDERPTDLLDLVRRLTFLQLDLTAAVAPSAPLVAWSRLGWTFDANELNAAVDDHTLVELAGRLRPAEDVVLYGAEMAAWPGVEPKDWELDVAAWVEANDACRRDILTRLESDGPLPARALPDSCEVPWKSSGWTNDKNVVRMLDFMAQRGEVAVSNRHGRERQWDLAERVYPDEPPLPLAEAARRRSEGRLRSLGLTRARASEMPGEPVLSTEVGETAVVEGVRGTWRVDPSLLDQPFTGRTALLSPLDRLVFDRKRMTELFEFDYQLEMYKPAAKRRWGYFALPVLVGDRLVGKLDATTDRRAGLLRVDDLHLDVELTDDEIGSVDAEIEDLARWLEVDLVRQDRR